MIDEDDVSYALGVMTALLCVSAVLFVIACAITIVVRW